MFVGNPPLRNKDGVRWLSAFDDSGKERKGCAGATAPTPMGIVAGGALDAAAGLTVRLPQGTYKLCAVWIGGKPSSDPTIDVRRRLDWDGVLEDLADSEFEWRPDITAYVDDWDDDGLGGPTASDSLTGAMGAMGLPWWALLVMILLLICCLCCCLLYCLLLRKVRKSYQPQGKNTTTQYRRGGFQRSLNNFDRKRLGMSLKDVLASATGLDTVVHSLSSQDDAALTGAEMSEFGPGSPETSDRLETFPSIHLHMKREILPTSKVAESLTSSRVSDDGAGASSDDLHVHRGSDGLRASIPSKDNDPFPSREPTSPKVNFSEMTKDLGDTEKPPPPAAPPVPPPYRRV